MTAHELYLSYRRGWQDGTRRRLKDEKFMTHPTRPDLTAAYVQGHADGERDYGAAMAAAMARYGYVPDILRANPVVVTVNGRPKAIEGQAELSYAEVVDMAFSGKRHPTGVLTVAYAKGREDRPHGTLVPGQSVGISGGMVFNVVRA